MYVACNVSVSARDASNTGTARPHSAFGHTPTFIAPKSPCTWQQRGGRMVVPLQVTGGVRLWPRMMEQTRFKLLTVEDTFYSVGRGVYVLPNISYASYSGPRERLVTV